LLSYSALDYIAEYVGYKAPSIRSRPFYPLLCNIMQRHKMQRSVARHRQRQTTDNFPPRRALCIILNELLATKDIRWTRSGKTGASEKAVPLPP
jgi:hypothetical protein